MPKGKITTVADLVAEPMYELSAESIVRFLIRSIENSRKELKELHVARVGLIHASAADNGEEVMSQWRVDARLIGEELTEECHRIGADVWEASKRDCRVFTMPQIYKVITQDAKGITVEAHRFEMQPPASKMMNSSEGSDYRGQAASAQRQGEFALRLYHEGSQYQADVLRGIVSDLRQHNAFLEQRVESLLKEKDAWLDGTHRREHEAKQAERDANSAEQFVNLLKDQVLPLLAEKYGATAKLKRFAESIGPEQAMAFGAFTAEQFEMLKEISPQIVETLMDKVQQRLTISQENPKNGV